MADTEEKELVRAAVARLRAGITAVVFGMVCGLGLAVATSWLLVRGGPEVGRTLGLLGNFFPGYTVTWPGVLVGLLYGFVFGGSVGWFTATIYNRITNLRERRRRTA